MQLMTTCGRLPNMLRDAEVRLAKGWADAEARLSGTGAGSRGKLGHLMIFLPHQNIG